MNRAKIKFLLKLVILGGIQTVLACFFSCSTTPVSVADGGGSRGGNPVITGTIVNHDGKVANNAIVHLRAANSNPMIVTSVQSTISTLTDMSGKFTIEAPDSGEYVIEAKSVSDGTRLIKFNIQTRKDSVCTLSVDTLHAPGVLKILIPENSDTNGSYVYVPGTSIGTWIHNSDTLIIDSIPATTLPNLYYSTNDTSLKSIRKNITILSNDTTVITNLEWSFNCQIILNTSATGANVTGDVFFFPVLIRLNSENFNFAEAQSKGEDINFTNLTGKSLSYEIVQWDNISQQAQIWVNVDTIYGNNSTQSIMMYWGNQDAKTRSSSTDVFDTASGFQGVWHLEEDGNNTAIDATLNGFDGIAYNIENSSLDGAIGNARKFQGDSSYIVMPNTKSGKLNYPQDGNFTISAWVYAETLDNAHHTIVAKGFKQYFLQLSYLPAAESNWEFSSFSQEKHWLMSNYPATEKTWMLLTGVKMRDSQYLFCNGELVASTSAVYTHTDAELDRDTTEDLSIGRFLNKATYPVDFGYCYFNGMIDEVRISSIARNDDWIKLSYMNQRSDDLLVKFKR